MKLPISPHSHRLSLLSDFWIRVNLVGGSDPGSSVVENPPANAGDTGLIPRSERSPGKGHHGNLLQYSCLENPMDRGAWWTTVHRVAKSWT